MLWKPNDLANLCTSVRAHVLQLAQLVKIVPTLLTLGTISPSQFTRAGDLLLGFNHTNQEFLLFFEMSFFS